MSHGSPERSGLSRVADVRYLPKWDGRSCVSSRSRSRHSPPVLGRSAEGAVDPTNPIHRHPGRATTYANTEGQHRTQRRSDCVATVLKWMISRKSSLSVEALSPHSEPEEVDGVSSASVRPSDATSGRAWPPPRQPYGSEKR